MLDRAKQLGQHSMRFFFKPAADLKIEDIKAARQYIADYWPKLQRFHPKDDETLIGVPKPYLVPSYAEGHEFDYNELYYWDSYFMVQGFLADSAHKELVLGILEDLCYIFKRFKLIPNGSRMYYVSRSQPPFLSSFIFDCYEAYHLSDDWLKEYIAIAKDEYQTVWMGTRKPNARQVYQGLSRYYDFNYLNDIAETESGWDMTPRFSRKALNYLPVDLNALLYKYEMDFARAALIFGNKKEAADWEDAAEKRKNTVDKLMWDQGKGLYYDYNYAKERRGNVASLAAYYPMWAGMVDGRTAQELVKQLKRFEKKGGVATTDTYALSQRIPGSLPMQWAYPNGWAPLQFITVKALQRYGYNKDAQRIARKWLRTNLDWFKAHSVFLEKYNVADPSKPPASGVYPSQTGFGWTNAVFERFCQEFIDGLHV
ncbi:MAG TPA: trehalase family glycosidase [Candidatus Saccharimonadales bacterium]|nr:trehalase family glycosidase [Candidatus Saccharimonadales bacterium]